MGTTSTALHSEPGNRIGFVLLIEGFPYIITDAGADQLEAVFNAYEESDWGEGTILGQLPGLKIIGQIRQAFEPWADTIDAPRLRFAVQPDDDDTLGIAVWKTKPSFETRLTALFAPAADGSGVLSVKQTTDAAASGTMYMGGKTLLYSAKGGTSLTVTKGNAYSPYAAGANTFTPGHSIAPQDMWDTAHPSKVQDVPRTWIGKKVALYLHRIRGGVWDSVDEADLRFAGTIKEISEDDEGQTVFECEDLRGLIRDSVLMRKQWTGFVREGIHLVTGMLFRAEQIRGTTRTDNTSSLEVVSSGAAGTDEVDAGYYTIEEFVAILDTWVSNDTALDGASNGWYAKINKDLRFEIGAEFASSASSWVMFYSNEPLAMKFLGFGDDLERANDWYMATASVTSSRCAVVSPGPPFRVQPIQHSSRKNGSTDEGYKLRLSGSDGVWWDHSAYLPSQYADWADGENYSLLLIGGEVFFGKYNSATELTDVQHVHGMNRSAGTSQRRGFMDGITIEDATDNYEVKQVVMLAGSLSSLLPKLFASLDGNEVNSDHDVFPWGAGIPWDLLGDDFLDSLKSLEQAADQDGMVVRLDKPTKMMDVLLPELALRMATIVWKDNGYQIVSPPTPNALTADWTLTEANKAGQVGQQLRSHSRRSQEWLRNVLKVDYNRGADGQYKDTVFVKDEASISDYGESQPVTIKAANSFADESGSGAVVQDLLGALAAKGLPFYGKPVVVVRRSIPPTHYDMAPCDTVSLSDDFVRDPTTGTRGLTTRGGVVLSVSHDWGQEGGDLFGECEILVSDEDRTYPYSPCAEVDHTYSDGTFTAGYSSTAVQLKLKQHAFSRSTDAKDVTHFEAGDLVRIYQVDPTDPTSITAWNRTIDTAGVDGTDDLITLTSTLSSPAFDSALRYRVVPQLFSAVQTSQKSHSFIADDGDGLIVDAAQPNLFGEMKAVSFTQTAITTLPELIPTEVDDEGRPVHPGLAYSFGVMVTNLINYGTGFNAPMMFDTSLTETSTSYVGRLTFPVWCGGAFPPGKTRYIKCAPRFRTSAGTGYVRITSSRLPPRGALTATKWYGARNHKEFTTTNTSTGGEEGTEANLRVIRGDNPGITYITVEMKATSTRTTTLYGLSRFYLGPLEDL